MLPVKYELIFYIFERISHPKGLLIINISVSEENFHRRERKIGRISLMVA
jgi:hypothetical protein